jgi:hypothetical protein
MPVSRAMLLVAVFIIVVKDALNAILFAILVKLYAKKVLRPSRELAEMPFHPIVGQMSRRTIVLRVFFRKENFTGLGRGLPRRSIMVRERIRPAARLYLQ